MPESARSARATFVFAGVLALAACGGDDPTRPPPSLALELSAATHVQAAPMADPPYLACDVTIRARAEGEPGAVAVLEGATVELIWGPDTTTMRDIQTYAASQVTTWFGTDSLAPGAEATLVGAIESDIPFLGRWRQRYRVDPAGDRETAVAEFHCGPAPVAGAGPPVVTLEAVGAPEAGHGMEVAYAITAEAGIWTATLRIEGVTDSPTPVEVDPWATTASGVVVAPLPWELPLGEPVRVVLTVTDAAGRTAEASLLTGPVQDTSPPRAEIEPVCDDWEAPCPLVIGQSLRVRSAFSDASVHWLVLSAGDPAVAVDSVRFPPGTSLVPLELPVPATWAGRHPVFATFVDTLGHAGPRLALGEVVVYSSVEAPTLTAAVEGLLHDVRLDPAREVLYLAHSGAAGVTRLGAADLVTLSPIALPVPPRGIDLTPSGDALLVVAPERLAVLVVDPDGARPLEEHPLTALEEGFEPLAIRAAANGHWLVHAERDIALSSSREVAIVAVDPGGGQRVIATGERPPGQVPQVVVSGDRSRAVVAPGCRRGYDATAGAGAEIGPCWAIDPFTLAADAAGTLFASRYYLFGPAGEELRNRLPVEGGSALAVGFSPAGELLALTHQGLTTVDVESWLPVVARPIPDPAPGGVEVGSTGDAAFLWIPREVGSRIVRVDLSGG